MTNELKIRDRFITEIERMLATLDIDLPLSYPNVVMTNYPVDNRYIEIIRLPNDPIISGWQTSIDQGIFNLGVHWDIDSGEGEVLSLCDMFANYFSMGLTLFFDGGKIIISAPPSIKTPMIDGQEVIYPVSIRYRSFSD